MMNAVNRFGDWDKARKESKSTPCTNTLLQKK
jgi:hypothetical protein